jgi:hypothetical protein
MNDAHWTKRRVASCRVVPEDQEARREAGETLWALEAPSQVYQVTIFQYHRDELRSSLVGSNHVCNASNVNLDSSLGPLLTSASILIV